MNILGLDPASFKNMGVCVLNIDEEKSDISIVKRFTKIFEVNKDTKDQRFEDLYKTIEDLVDENKIEAICFERTQFGAPFVISQIYETIGVIKLVAQKKKISLKEISPKTAKLKISGSGKSTKKEMMAAVCNYFSLNKKELSSDHEADAIAMCFAYYKIREEG